jgi:hypothetical protein
LQKGCTRLAAASDKVYQLLAHGRWFSPGLESISTIIGKLDIFRLMCAADKVWIAELTLIHKNIRSVRNLHISQSDVMSNPFTLKIFPGEIKGKMYY